MAFCIYIVKIYFLCTNIEKDNKNKSDFDEEEFDTLNGFLISKMDKIPDENEQFEITIEGYNFKVLSVENKMIHTVLVTKIPEPSIEDEE